MATPTVECVTTTEQLQAMLETHGRPVRSKMKLLGLHFQFLREKQDEVAAVAIGSDSPSSTVVVLQVPRLAKKPLVLGIKALLEDPNVVKVLDDVQRVARWLRRVGLSDAAVVNCLDLQILYRHVEEKCSLRSSLVQVAARLGSSSLAAVAKQVMEFNAQATMKEWRTTPLAPSAVGVLIQTVQLYVRCYNASQGITDVRTAIPSLIRDTQAVWINCNGVARPSETRSNSPPHVLDLPPPPDSFVRSEVKDDLPNEEAAIITTDAQLKYLLTATKNRFVDVGEKIVGIHFQFTQERTSGLSDYDDDKLVAIGIVGVDPLNRGVVLQLTTLGAEQVLTGLKTLLNSACTIKVLHNFHRAAFWLQQSGLTDVQLANCVDLQLVYENTISTATLRASILQITTQCCATQPSSRLAQTIQSFKAILKPVDPTEWIHPPLSQRLVHEVSNTAQLYAQCYVELSISAIDLQVLDGMTNTRWKNAVVNQGNPAIWFDSSADYQPRSVECFTAGLALIEDASPMLIPQLELQCEIEPLLDLLPVEYQRAIRSIANYQTRLVDICLDVGRIPYVYTGKKQRVLLTQDGTTVSQDTIDEIIDNLGGEMRIGDDNRAGIDRQLHRISVMRSKADEIYGVTMRVGRALCNAASVLTDLLLSEKHSAKSVLVLGHPGSGKTTLIRDVARCISETMENVCIIDTSNEIGGDGLVPHTCVGWSRRMMVRSLEEQASVMIECVQNHTVETLIIDEIGRKAEVLAAGTVRQRGPRLIASAHGDFRALIKNPDLKGLVGGSQQVILGDVAAAKSSSKNKLQTQRAGSPIFDVIVELDHVVRGRCRIIWDVAKAVDSVLDGQEYSVESRQWDMSTRGVLVLGA